MPRALGLSDPDQLFDISEDLIEARLELGLNAWNDQPFYYGIDPTLKCAYAATKVANFYDNGFSTSFTLLYAAYEWEEIFAYWFATCYTISEISSYVNAVIVSPDALYLDKLELMSPGIENYVEQRSPDLSYNAYTYQVEIDVCVDVGYTSGASFSCDDRIFQVNPEFRDTNVFEKEYAPAPAPKGGGGKKGRGKGRRLGEEEDDPKIIHSHSSLLIFDDALGINAAVAAYQQASGAEVGVQTDVLAATLEQKWSALAMSAELKASMQDLVVQMGFGPN